MSAHLRPAAARSPFRHHGEGALVARPTDGEVMYLRGATAVVWLWAAGELSTDDFADRLATATGDDRAVEDEAGVSVIVRALVEEGLLADGR